MDRSSLCLHMCMTTLIQGQSPVSVLPHFFLWKVPGDLYWCQSILPCHVGQVLLILQDMSCISPNFSVNDMAVKQWSEALAMYSVSWRYLEIVRKPIRKSTSHRRAPTTLKGSISFMMNSSPHLGQQPCSTHNLDDFLQGKINGVGNAHKLCLQSCYFHILCIFCYCQVWYFCFPYSIPRECSCIPVYISFSTWDAGCDFSSPSLEEK